MPAMTNARTLNFAASLPQESREAIETLLADQPKATRKVYAALAHKVWSLLVERRFDAEIRDWHDLIHGARARVRATDGVAAERLTALADLLRESISLAQTSPARVVANRPRARSILETLDKARGYVPRCELLAELQLGSSNLSNVLTQLAAHALIERRDRGKEAEYRITPLGRQHIGADGVREDAADKRLPAPADALANRVRQIDADQLHSLTGIAQSVPPGPSIIVHAGYQVAFKPTPPICGVVEYRAGADVDATDPTLWRVSDPSMLFRRTGRHLSLSRD